ncbi:glycosyltransferase family 2 protein [Dyadobacter fermentans]|uniref:Glycosyl transferase family 2 n=1 Tax=Dyadobacter fermentans (strain ATCC 700827 / DSM 18053 / CIP 107007 / KCTC 52180 / NS114) TaxID=471854 RepID=C6VYA6_DYAFD|nr:glycosyltransferase family 2 protein [Dyadobacter fermentans]ACT91585.1 glycosyl transferase family 2 [Dyadobacter fermentans DSM 18053]
MENPPLISIALCTYNGSAFLREQLDSILAQRYAHWELVVVDDGSTDPTRAILEEYAGSDARISLHYNRQNLGYNKNFEKALGLCQSDLIAICDQDDIWHPEKLEKQVQLIGNHTLVYHDSEFVNAEGRSMNRRISDKLNFYRGNAPEVFLFLNCVSGHSILLKKEVLQKSLPFPGNFHYDQWLAFNAACLGSIDFVPETLVKYRQHATNNTDILALKKVAKSADQKAAALEQESNWLHLCARQCTGQAHGLINALYNQSIRRNDRFFDPAFGILVWKHRDTLLRLLKKSDTSKFFYALRKAWGVKAKMTGK